MSHDTDTARYVAATKDLSNAECIAIGKRTDANYPEHRAEDYHRVRAGMVLEQEKKAATARADAAPARVQRTDAPDPASDFLAAAVASGTAAQRDRFRQSNGIARQDSDNAAADIVGRIVIARAAILAQSSQAQMDTMKAALTSCCDTLEAMVDTDPHNATANDPRRPSMGL